jgi:glutathione S-transferase
MTDLTLFGFPISTYVRTARLALAEKGLDYELDPVSPHTPELVRHQPFGKVPAFRHGAFEVYETMAITRYVDEAFPGPALQPAAPAARARMTQWVSVVNGYLYPTVIGQIVLERMAPKFFDRPADEAKIAAAMPGAALQLDTLDKALGETPYLAGERVSLADMFALPILFYGSLTPEAGALINARPALARWYERMNARPATQATVPPLNG